MEYSLSSLLKIKNRIKEKLAQSLKDLQPVGNSDPYFVGTTIRRSNRAGTLTSSSTISAKSPKFYTADTEHKKESVETDSSRLAQSKINQTLEDYKKVKASYDEFITLRELYLKVCIEITKANAESGIAQLVKEKEVLKAYGPINTAASEMVDPEYKFYEYNYSVEDGNVFVEAVFKLEGSLEAFKEFDAKTVKERVWKLTDEIEARSHTHKVKLDLDLSAYMA